MINFVEAQQCEAAAAVSIQHKLLRKWNYILQKQAALTAALCWYSSVLVLIAYKLDFL